MGRVNYSRRMLALSLAVAGVSLPAVAQQAQPPTTQPAGNSGFQNVPPNQPAVIRPLTTQSAKEVTLNFKDTSIDAVLNYFSEMLGYTVVRETTVSGRITIISRVAVPADQAMIMLNAALKPNNLTAVRSNDVTNNNIKILRVISRSDAPTANLPVYYFDGDLSKIEDSDEMITEVIPVHSVDAQRLRQDLAPLFAGTVVSNQGSNTLIITDSATNIKRIARIVSSLDSTSPTNATMKMETLKNANAANMAKLILQLYKPDTSNQQGNAGGPGGPGGPGGFGRGGGFGGRGGGGGGPGGFLGGILGGGNRGGNQQGTGALQTQINAVSDDRTNTLILTGPEKVLEDIIKLAKQLDESTIPDSAVRIFKLKYADAEATSKELTTIFKPDNNGASAATALLPAFLRFQAQQNAGSTDKSAVTVNITADDRTNSVIVAAPIVALGEIQKMIDTLDSDQVAKTEMRIFQLQFADSDSAAKLIQGVFPNSNTTTSTGGNTGGGGFGPGGGGFGRGGGFGGRGGFFGGGGLGGGPGGAGVNVTANTPPVNAVSDERTNTLVVTASPDEMKLVAALVDKLESNPQTEQSIFIYRLRNAQSSNLQSVLNVLFGSGSGTGLGTGGVGSRTSGNSLSGRTSTPGGTGGGGGRGGGRGGGGGGGGGFGGGGGGGFGGGGGGINRNVAGGTRGGTTGGFGGGGLSSSNQRASNELTGQVFVVAEPDTNSLLVSSPTRYQEQVKQIIAELDRPVRQVLIKALVVEVTHSDSLDFGVDLNGTNLRTGSVNGNAASLGQTFTSSLGNVASQTNTGGLAFSILEDHINATLHLLQQEGKLDVLSRPSILATDNQEAMIQVGQQLPYISDVIVTTSGNPINTISYASIGIILDVTPHINPDGIVTLDVAPQISSISDSTVTVSQGVTQPIINTRQADSRVQVRDGQTVVIGGLMQDQKTSTINKVPILGDIPLVGQIFRRTETQKVKTELMIFLTPHVAPEPDQLKPMSEDEMKDKKLTPNAVAPGTFQEHMRGMERGQAPTTGPTTPSDPVKSFDLSRGRVDANGQPQNPPTNPSQPNQSNDAPPVNKDSNH